MSLTHPWMLLVVLVGIVGAARLLNAFSERQTRDALTYSHLPFIAGLAAESRWRERWLRIAWITATGLLLLALTGPHFLVPVPVRDGAIVICIDTSGSMASTDVAPTRAIAARRAVRAFLQTLPPGVRVGIVAFSSGVGIVQPLTANHARAIASLMQIPPPNGATAIGDALDTAAQMLPKHGHRAIVLVTDGVNNTGVNPLSVAQTLGARAIPIYPVGIGTNTGAIIPGTSDQAGLNGAALRSYAQAGGGTYARAHTAQTLQRKLAQLGHVTGFKAKFIDASLALAWLGGALALVGVVVGRFWGKVP